MASIARNVDYATETAEPTPRTISSAIGRVESLHERLLGILSDVTKVSEAIGGPRPLAGGAKSAAPPVSGAVGKLNDTADRCHEVALDIESTLSSIQRSLG